GMRALVGRGVMFGFSTKQRAGPEPLPASLVAQPAAPQGYRSRGSEGGQDEFLEPHVPGQGDPIRGESAPSAAGTAVGVEYDFDQLKVITVDELPLAIVPRPTVAIRAGGGGPGSGGWPENGFRLGLSHPVEHDPFNLVLPRFRRPRK